MMLISYTLPIFVILKVNSAKEFTLNGTYYESMVVYSISLASNVNHGIRMWKRHLYQNNQNMSLEKRRSLCIAALNYASLPPIDEEEYISQPELYEYQDWDEDKLAFSKKVTIGLDCRSYPSLYLGLRLYDTYLMQYGTTIRADQHIVLMFPANHRYTFLEEIVTNIPTKEIWPGQNQTLHIFNEFDRLDCWNLCFSAKDRILRGIKFNSTHGKDIFAEYYATDFDVSVFAIKCPTIPPIYLTLTDSTYRRDYTGDRVVKIILVKSDLEAQKQSESLKDDELSESGSREKSEIRFKVP